MDSRRFRRIASPAAPVTAAGLGARVLEALEGEPLSVRELLLRTGAESDVLDHVLVELQTSGMIDCEDDAIAADRDAQLPEGVMPWTGEEMPVGRTLPPVPLPVPVADSAPDSDSESDPDAAPDSDSEPESAAVPPLSAEATASYRRLYDERCRGTTTDERIAMARSARGDLLYALCFDPEPPVISALIDNPEIGLLHVRLAAAHHRNARGLEILTRRLDWLRDGQIARALLHNPQLPEATLGRLVANKRLRDLYKLCVDRDLPELTRTRVRAHLRRRFTTAEPEERVELVMRTEGRALNFLIGCTFDGRSSQMLAAQTFVSSLLVQNLARFSATPPMVLARLLQQPMVRRQPQLRAMILRHPNVPSEAKRG